VFGLRDDQRAAVNRRRDGPWLEDANESDRSQTGAKNGCLPGRFERCRRTIDGTDNAIKNYAPAADDR
jgi:hypothetical protein